jgi:hypothetical protein
MTKPVIFTVDDPEGLTSGRARSPAPILLKRRLMGREDTYREPETHTLEPFSTTKSVGGGTRLGLDIVRDIVTGRHNGDIWVDSRPGETRFMVRLPLNPGQRDGG